MWQESDSAVGDRLTSRVLGGGGRIDDPVKVSSWWTDQGIAIDSAELSRDVLFALATQCRERADADWCPSCGTFLRGA